jgi:hypothetical protein
MSNRSSLVVPARPNIRYLRIFVVGYRLCVARPRETGFNRDNKP